MLSNAPLGFKWILASAGLFSALLISGCKEEQPKYVPPEPVGTLEYFIRVGAPGKLMEREEKLFKEICQALGATAKYDSGTRRAILKDYDFDLSTIAFVEARIDKLGNFRGAKKLPFLVKGRDDFL